MKSDKFEVQAPTRADLCGGTIDIWPLYTFFGPARTINTALTLHTKAKFEILPSVSFQLEVSNGAAKATIDEDFLEEALPSVPHEVRFPTWVCGAFLRGKSLPEKIVRVSYSSEAPRQSGLGGSSVLAIALIAGLRHLLGEESEKGWQWRVLEQARDIEAAYLKTLTGLQDYLAPLFGGLRSYGFGLGDFSETKYSDNVTEELSERMLILFSGELHQSGLSNWEVIKGAVDKKREITDGFYRVKEIGEKVDELLQARTRDWSEIGKSLSEDWEIRRNLFKVETKRLEEITDFLDKQPILGRKVCGAAAGGSFLVLADPEKRGAVIAACKKNGIQVLECTIEPEPVTIL